MPNLSPASGLPEPDLDHVLEHTGDLWAHARGTRTFITGGTGFFGAWIVEAFGHANERLGLDAELVVLTRDPAAAVQRLPRLATIRGVSLWQGDVRDFATPPGRFDLVIHGAAESSQQGHVGDQRHMFDTILDGTRRTLALARSAEARTYLLLSSGAVYGLQPTAISHIGETYNGAPDTGDPRSAYGEGKRAAEVLTAVESSATGMSARIARCFAFVGPHLPLDAHFAIGNFVRDALLGRSIRIQGDGTAVRSYMYAADLAVWLWTLALRPNASGAYNVGSEEPMTILETARSVAAVCAPGAPIEVLGRPSAGPPPHRYVPSTSRARTELELRQHIGVADGIRRFVEWLETRDHTLRRPRP
jgi:nucleoside-diphosphate-sugar epimerase